ncbi:iron-siderophore ABC transporter substrate-binding protein [Amycolatopsis nigrescens]|uniref:iron-siderophore ABC transporter substrate-binding protein n=1 Tax=Amycolatopsis nigrescens TaxID=381445 RepID=UPI000477863A|nr:iron-siderophore ABC transporter substrate-binding protein [Amycolatopsis nigrescens]
MSLRRTRVALLVLALAAVLAACGGQGEQSAQAPAGGAFPVTVAHKYGSTEIKAAPARVVTLGLSDQDAVLALGVKPVGVVDWFKERPFGKWPWTQALWGGVQPEIVGERDEFNLEKIAALRPDLIIAQYSGMTKEQYDKLSRIAPVVGQPAGPKDYGATWQEMTRAIAKSLGQQARGDQLVADMDQRYAKVRAEHPEFAGQTIAVADTFKPGEYGVFAPDDPKSLFVTAMGFKLSDEINALVGDENVANIGVERTDLLELDRLMWLTSDAEAEQRIRTDPLYQQLKVTQEKRDLFVSYENPPIGAAISFNTVLSIPYAIDQTVPLLAAKAK